MYVIMEKKNNGKCLSFTKEDLKQENAIWVMGDMLQNIDIIRNESPQILQPFIEKFGGVLHKVPDIMVKM